MSSLLFDCYSCFAFSYDLLLSYFHSGLDRFEARKKVWSDLEETDLAVKKEPHALRVPRSQRGGEVLFFLFIVCYYIRFSSGKSFTAHDLLFH